MRAVSHLIVLVVGALLGASLLLVSEDYLAAALPHLVLALAILLGLCATLLLCVTVLRSRATAEARRQEDTISSVCARSP